MVAWKLLAGAAVVLGTMTANAADPQPADQPVDTTKAMLDRMDRNVDGKISLEECGVRLSRQRCSQGCWQNDTWGCDRNRIWVDRGCRAEFDVGGQRSSSASKGDALAAATVLGIAAAAIIASKQHDNHHNKNDNRNYDDHYNDSYDDRYNENYRRGDRDSSRYG